MTRPLDSPEVLPGLSYKLCWPDSGHAIYITLNDVVRDGRRRPFEIFINSKNMEHYACSAPGKSIQASRAKNACCMSIHTKSMGIPAAMRESPTRYIVNPALGATACASPRGPPPAASPWK